MSSSKIEDEAARLASLGDSDKGKKRKELTEAMLTTKSRRRRAECDVQLLANRLAHLRAEEAKAKKKIEETKKRAKEIRELKAANHRSQLDKQRHKMMQSGASSDEVKRIQLTRAKRIEKRRAKLKAKQKDKLVDVKRMKELKKQNLEKIQRIKEEEKIKKQKQKLQVKMREQALIKKREEEKKKREEEQFKRYLEKMQLEEEKMMAAETAIEKLEREEMELIQMLRATQNDQRNAYEDLENALGEELPGGDAFSMAEEGKE